MKLISKGIFAKKKTFIIFFFSLVLPLIVIAYLGFDTFSERQKSTKKLLESNLWITGESALNQLEDKLIRIEKNILSVQYFQQIISDTLSAREQGNKVEELKNNYYSPFLLDRNFKIIYPKTETNGNKELEYKTSVSHSQFERAFQIAESYEFLQSNYSKAIQQYRKCYAIAETKRDKAFALEGIGRIQLSQKKYSDAAKSYILLHKEYPQVFNKVRHPYGIIGLLQLHEINKYLGTDKNIFPKFLDTYKKLKDGFWILNSSSYNFFISEIESVLESELLKSYNAKYKEEHESLISRSSSYLEDLMFSNFLRADIINKIYGTFVTTDSVNNFQSKRIINNFNRKWSLISYRQLINFIDSENYICGFKWNTDTLRRSIIPAIIDSISAETGLNYYLLEEVDSFTNQLPENSLSLSFRRFPFPWKLIVEQPALNSLEDATKKEMLIYGLMLGITITMMILGALLIARDIKRESDSMSLKTEFVHNVSHELKTPLSLIRLYGETLLFKKNLNNIDKTDALQVITKESERLSHMINNILDFSKIEMGRKEFKIQRGNFANIIRDTLDSYRYHLEKKGFEIIEEIAQDIPLIEFDKEAIEGLLINLLSNAIKYSPERKILTVKLYKQNEYVLLQVSDKGMGIPSDEIPHIFNRFYRSKQKLGFESRGSGLGLTLIKHVVESHGGKIKVESKPGEGSTFSIEFPILKSFLGNKE